MAEYFLDVVMKCTLPVALFSLPYIDECQLKELLLQFFIENGLKIKLLLNSLLLAIWKCADVQVFRSSITFI